MHTERIETRTSSKIHAITLFIATELVTISSTTRRSCAGSFETALSAGSPLSL